MNSAKSPSRRGVRVLRVNSKRQCRFLSAPQMESNAVRPFAALLISLGGGNVSRLDRG